MELQVDNIITELSKIDSSSKDIIESSNKEMEACNKEHQKRIEEFDKSLKDKLTSELEEIKNDINKTYDEKLAVLEKETDKQIQQKQDTRLTYRNQFLF